MTQEEYIIQQKAKLASAEGEKDSAGAVRQIAPDYDATMSALRQAEASLPEYTTPYDAEISSLYDKLVNRPSFTYQPSADPLYQQYAQQYQRSGQLAMRDTMGAASSLTGGYGSSYSQAAGQQQYESYMLRLGEVLPQLYSMALQRYNAQGDELRGNIDTGNALADAAYSRQRDRSSDARYGYEQSVKREQTVYDRQQDAYEALYKIISTTGYMPTSQELAQAGMSDTQAAATAYEYLRQNNLLPVSGGGGGISIEYNPYAYDNSGNKSGSSLNAKEQALLNASSVSFKEPKAPTVTKRYK